MTLTIDRERNNKDKNEYLRLIKIAAVDKTQTGECKKKCDEIREKEKQKTTK